MSINDQVEQLQEAMGMGANADGMWGRNTSAEFTQFVHGIQTELGIAADGWYGDQTNEAVREAVEAGILDAEIGNLLIDLYESGNMNSLHSGRQDDLHEQMRAGTYEANAENQAEVSALFNRPAAPAAEAEPAPAPDVATEVAAPAEVVLDEEPLTAAFVAPSGGASEGVELAPAPAPLAAVTPDEAPVIETRSFGVTPTRVDLEGLDRFLVEDVATSLNAASAYGFLDPQQILGASGDIMDLVDAGQSVEAAQLAYDTTGTVIAEVRANGEDFMGVVPVLEDHRAEIETYAAEAGFTLEAPDVVAPVAVVEEDPTGLDMDAGAAAPVATAEGVMDAFAAPAEIVVESLPPVEVAEAEAAAIDVSGLSTHEATLVQFVDTDIVTFAEGIVGLDELSTGHFAEDITLLREALASGDVAEIAQIAYNVMNTASEGIGTMESPGALGEEATSLSHDLRTNILGSETDITWTPTDEFFQGLPIQTAMPFSNADLEALGYSFGDIAVDIGTMTVVDGDYQGALDASLGLLGQGQTQLENLDQTGTRAYEDVTSAYEEIRSTAEGLGFDVPAADAPALGSDALLLSNLGFQHGDPETATAMAFGVAVSGQNLGLTFGQQPDIGLAFDHDNSDREFSLTA